MEDYPFGLLTIANQQWTTVQEEDRQNRELLDLSHEILELTRSVHAYASAAARDGSADRHVSRSSDTG